MGCEAIFGVMASSCEAPCKAGRGTESATDATNARILLKKKESLLKRLQGKNLSASFLSPGFRKNPERKRFKDSFSL